jgi:2-polyprenyl-3-methyl-5-hydroxy-6-metoxy-1,4-benzoquinol methylase
VIGAVAMKLPPLKYVCVDDWVTEQARNRSVLHLGCAGEYLARGPGACLHGWIVGVARCVWGVEIDPHRLEQVRRWFPEDHDGRVRYICGDVTKLQELQIDRDFEVILAGSIIEHIANAGELLQGMRDLCDPDSRVIIVTPNAFGLHQFLNVAMRKTEVVNLQHTCWFSIQTLTELCARYGLRPSQWLTGYGWQPPNLKWALQKGIGVPFFRMFPHLGGSLIGVFRLAPGQ